MQVFNSFLYATAQHILALEASRRIWKFLNHNQSLKGTSYESFLISIKGANFRYLIADDSFYSNMVLLNNDKIQLPWLDALQIYLLMISNRSLSVSQVGSKSS